MSLTFLFKKILVFLISIFVVFYIVFIIIYLSQINVVSMNVRKQGIKLNKEEKFRLSKATKEYFLWLKNLKTFSLGRSSFFGEEVVVILKEKLKNTVILNALALLILVAGGIVLGVVSVFGKNWLIRFIELIFFVIYAIPDFILAIFLILFFSIKLGLLPSCGIVSVNYESLDPLSQILDYIKHLLLPALSLSLSSIIFLARFTRNSIVGILKYPHIIALKVRGVDTFSVKLKHVLKNAVYPFISLLTFILPGLIGGSIIIETIFGYPGIGRVFFVAVNQRDFYLLVAVSFVNVLIIYLSIFITDILYEIFKAGERNERIY